MKPDLQKKEPAGNTWTTGPSHVPERGGTNDSAGAMVVRFPPAPIARPPQFELVLNPPEKKHWIWQLTVPDPGKPCTRT